MKSRLCLLLFIALLSMSLVGGCSGFKNWWKGPETAKTPSAPLPAVSRLEPIPSQPAQQQMTRKEERQKPMMESVFFETGRHNVTAQSAEVLKQEAEWLKQNREPKIRISGNADQRGGAGYNRKLAMKRAEAVKNQLAELGVDPDRLETASYGKDRPMCQEASKNCYATNRRVDLQAIG